MLATLTLLLPIDSRATSAFEMSAAEHPAAIGDVWRKIVVAMLDPEVVAEPLLIIPLS